VADSYSWWDVVTPVGRVVLVGDDEALRLLYLPGRAPAGPPSGSGAADKARPAALALAQEQLEAYFAGSLKRFDLPLQPEGSNWQKSVWAALSEIPYGATHSYGDVARQVGSPRASRAVGAAVGRNPLAIVVPCHRVIGSDGSLTGYGGGLSLKAQLLSHERRAALGSF